MANKLSVDEKVSAIGMLCEGNSIRSVERMTGIHRDTVIGMVETFDLDGHPKAKRCYAFLMKDEKDPARAGEMVLELPPVGSPESAVQVAIANKARK